MMKQKAFVRFFAALLVTWAWIAIMKHEVQPLTSREIVSFEFARTPEQVLTWIQYFDREGLRSQFEVSIYLDFIFLLIYPLPFVFACRAIAAAGSGRVQRVSARFARWIWLAAVCDMIENLGILYTLHGHPTGLVTHATAFFALLKFSILLAAFAAVAAGTFWLLFAVRITQMRT